MNSAPSDERAVPRGALAADIVAALLVAIGVLVVVLGPTPRLYFLGVRWSISSPDRAVFAALVILAIRHVLVPRHPLLARLLRRDSGAAADEAGILAAASRSLRSRVGELAVVTAGFTALVAAMTWPQAVRLDSVPDMGDPLFSTWRISWLAHQVLRDPVHLFNGNTFHPETLTLTYSDSVVVPALMSAPLLWMGVHQLTAYNLLLLSGFVFSGVATYFLVRALTGRRDAAAIAGTIFAVCAYRFEHYSHLELQMTMWIPLTLWGLHRTMVRGRLRDGLATGAAFGLQTLSSLYYGLFLAVYLVPIAAALWLAKGRPRQPVRALAGGALLAALMVAPVAAQYIRNTPVLGERSDYEVGYYSAKPVDYLQPHFRSRWYGAWSPGGQPERHLFPGLAPVALTAVALWPPISAVRMGYAAALIVALDGSLGSNGIAFPWLREWLTPFRGLRVPARFVILVVFSLAILAGYAAAGMCRRWPRHQVLVAGALLAVVAIEPLPRLELEPVYRQPPDIYRSIPASAVIAEFPIGEDWGIPLDTRYTYFSTFHWRRLVNGNSGFFPPSYYEFLEEVEEFPSAGSIEYLRDRGVDYFTLHGAFLSDRRYRRVIEILRRRKGVEVVDRVKWEDSESRLYRLVR